MRGSKAVVGVYSYLDDLLKGIADIRSADLDYKVYSPAYRHEIEEATLPGKSSVRRFTLTGGIIGCTFGWTLAILCSLDWPLRVSAKDIVSPPGFFVIGYECTILFGALATLGSLLLYCGLPNFLRKVGYDPRFSRDKFGLVVGCDGHNLEDVKGRLMKSGADEVNVTEGI
ncbi:MAG: DUF3341 domain-containing protein [Deltaproteobacteria bacterium]|nr:DUF3341 domain-containing protein [Deltaproteobacteria bacterium]